MTKSIDKHLTKRRRETRVIKITCFLPFEGPKRKLNSSITLLQKYHFLCDIYLAHGNFIIDQEHEIILIINVIKEYMPFQKGLTGFTVYPFYGMKMSRITENYERYHYVRGSNQVNHID